MKYQWHHWLALLATLGFSVVATALNSKPPEGTGVRLAKEAMALVMFAEMGNLGARDQEFSDSTFPKTDIERLVDTEIAPLFRLLAKADGKSNPTRNADIVSMLKSLPKQMDGGVGVVQKMYAQEKQKYLDANGPSRAGLALATMIQTVVHQKRLAMKEIGASLNIK